MLAKVARLVAGRTLLVGVGGIDSGETALAKIEAGATLVQLYSSMIYEGIGLVDGIKSHLVAAMEKEGASSLAPFVGRRVEEWASKPIEV
jgi:dihydroorotate dehydrogenase